MTGGPIALDRVGLSRLRPELDAIEIESPSMNDIATLVPKVDGDSYDQLFLEASRSAGSVEIAIVGGRDDRVALHIFDGDETHYLRVAEDGKTGGYSLVSSGGSEIDVLTRWLVSIDRAARGLWYFLLTGDLDPGLAWDRLSGVDFAPGS